MKQLIDKLYHTGRLLPDEFRALLSNRNDELYGYLSERPEKARVRNYGHDVYIRALEFTNYCRNDCLYCGIGKATAVRSVIV